MSLSVSEPHKTKKRKVVSSSDTELEETKRPKTIEEQLDAIDERLDTIEERLETIESDLNTMKDDLKTIKTTSQRIETKVNHLYESVKAKHIEKWASEVWHFDSLEGASTYNFYVKNENDDEDNFLRTVFLNVSNALKNNPTYLALFRGVFGETFVDITEQEVNLVSRAFRRNAPYWQYIVNYSTNPNTQIPENFIWNALLLKMTTTPLPTKFSNELNSLIKTLGARALDQLAQKAEHHKEKQLLAKLLQMERQVLLLCNYYRLHNLDNVFVILSSPSWKQALPGRKTVGDEVLGKLFQKDSLFASAFPSLKQLYENGNFIARGI